jgi:hypothetical protein
MSNEEIIQREVLARMVLIYEAFDKHLATRAALNFNTAFGNFDPIASAKYEAFQDARMVLNKEFVMLPPVDLVFKEKMRQSKDVAVTELEQLFRMEGRRMNFPINRIVSIIEKAQRL